VDDVKTTSDEPSRQFTTAQVVQEWCISIRSSSEDGRDATRAGLSRQDTCLGTNPSLGCAALIRLL
jgi:hypothetical protein